MTYMVADAGIASCTKITFSIWFYLSQKALDQQKADTKAFDDSTGLPIGSHKRVPIFEIGSSISPRVGIRLGFSLDWESFLGAAWWSGGVAGPDALLGLIWEYWISGIGAKPGVYGIDKPTEPLKGQWSPWLVAPCIYRTDSNYDAAPGGWSNNGALFGGYADDLFNAASLFYPQSWGKLVQPVVNYNGFSDKGIEDFNVRNYDGSDFVVGYGYTELQKANKWTYTGPMYCLKTLPELGIKGPVGKAKVGDATTQHILINSQITFGVLTPLFTPLEGTMQPTPTKGPRADRTLPCFDAGAVKPLAYGDHMSIFPMRKEVNYGEPAEPCVLYLDSGTVYFEIAGKWPGKNDMNDKGNMMPKLAFPADGLKSEDWNHVWFSCDLSLMGFSGGNIDRIRNWQKNLGGDPVAPPTLAKLPTAAMVLNGGDVLTPSYEDVTDTLTGKVNRVFKNIEPKLNVYMDQKDFVMSFAGNILEQRVPGQKPQQVGFPVISQEIGRWATTGLPAEIQYAYTHIYFDRYIEPTEKNLAAFVRKIKDPTTGEVKSVAPPVDKKAAIKLFGKPDFWLYRDKNNNIRFENNQGTGGKFTLIGPEASPPEEFPPPSAIRDFRPGPGQGKPPKST